jgi:myo-inositol catabolism protein IolC
VTELLILAFDHRDSLERDLYGLTAPPTPDEAASISADKLLVYQALLDAVPDLPARAQPGILIDEQYGAAVLELAARSGGAVNLSMPIEASGQEWFHFAYGDQWREHAEFFASDHVKVLVRDNPGLDATDRAQQAARLADVASWAQGASRSLILELLVPAGDADLNSVDGDKARYDRDLRPKLTIEVIEYLQDNGVEPALWKVEGLDQHDDAVAVAAAAKRDGRNADCIVLGRHASKENLDHWLKVAAPVAGFVGFAIGRSIWWDALLDQLHGTSSAKQTRNRITRSYLDFATYYLDRVTPA